MRVKDLLKANPKELVTASATTEILEAMRLLIQNRISCLLITDDEGTLKGIVNAIDVAGARSQESHSAP